MMEDPFFFIMLMVGVAFCVGAVVVFTMGGSK